MLFMEKNDINYAIKVSNISKVYSNNKNALDDVSLSIPKGSFFALSRNP